MSITLKEIYSYTSGSGGKKRYFQADHGDKKVLFSLREWESDTPRSIEEVTEAYLKVEYPKYMSEEDLEDFYAYPLAIFQLSIINNKFFNLEAQNMSVWEYETLLKGNTVHPALKCACIQHQKDSSELWVICESYDDDSMTTNANLKIVNKHWNKIKNELMKLLDKAYDVVECYGEYR